MRQILTTMVVAACVYVVAAMLLHLAGVYRVMISAAVIGGDWYPTYALPPVLPGAMLAPLAFALWGRTELSWRRFVAASVVVTAAIVLVRQYDLWRYPLQTWTALRDHWAHPYVQEAVVLVERDAVYALVCTLLAEAAVMGTLRWRAVQRNRTTGCPTRA